MPKVEVHPFDKKEELDSQKNPPETKITKKPKEMNVERGKKEKKGVKSQKKGLIVNQPVAFSVGYETSLKASLVERRRPAPLKANLWKFSTCKNTTVKGPVRLIRVGHLRYAAKC